jgi:hypothetical protein
MFLGKYGGETSLVLEAASSQADNINPYTGNIGALREFADELSDMTETVAGYAAEIETRGTTSGADDATPEYTTFTVGTAGYEGYHSGRSAILIDKPMIDYAGDMSDVFPPPPDMTTNTPKPEEFFKELSLYTDDDGDGASDADSASDYGTGDDEEGSGGGSPGEGGDTGGSGATPDKVAAGPGAYGREEEL